MTIFDHKKYLDNAKNGGKVSYNKTGGYLFNNETLGFRLDTKDEIELNEKDWSNLPQKIDSILDYATALVGFMRVMANKSHLHKNDWNRTIFIDTLTVKTTDFDISETMIKKLIESGRDGTKEYFKWRESSANTTCPVPL